MDHGSIAARTGQTSPRLFINAYCHPEPKPTGRRKKHQPPRYFFRPASAGIGCTPIPWAQSHMIMTELESPMRTLRCLDRGR
jgi:hypothetical protein